MKQVDTSYNSVRKALGVLKAFGAGHTEMGTTELAERMGIGKSTTSKLLGVLKETEFVQQNPGNRKYSLGPACAALGAAYDDSRNNRLVDTARPIAEKLRDKIGETVVFALPGPRGVIQSFIAEGFGQLVLKGFVGAVNEYHCTAGGKVFLAHGTKAFLDEYLRRALKGRTSQTITDPDTLKRELEIIRERGFGFDAQENHIGIQALAVPIFNPAGSPIASLTVAGAAQMVTWERRDEIVPLLSDAARRMETRLSRSG